MSARGKQRLPHNRLNPSCYLYDHIVVKYFEYIVNTQHKEYLMKKKLITFFYDRVSSLSLRKLALVALGHAKLNKYCYNLILLIFSQL